MSWRENAKKRAALEATKLLKEGFIVGLGSGSTVTYAIKGIGETIQQKGLHLFGIPTSYQSLMLAVENGIPITTLNEHPQLDLAIDGADQIDKKLNLIKGMGGALMREKIVASAAKKFVIVADETKLVERLGTNHSVPIEVFPFSLPKHHRSKCLRIRSSQNGPKSREAGRFSLVCDAILRGLQSPEIFTRAIVSRKYADWDSLWLFIVVGLHLFFRKDRTGKSDSGKKLRLE